MANVVVKGVDQTTGRIRRVDPADAAVKTNLSSIVSDQAGTANGLATLNGSSLVVQNPASAATTVTPNAIVQRTGTSAILVSLTPSSNNDATSKSYVDAQVFTGREDVLVRNQLISGGSGGISQALLCAVQINITVGDTFVITDGTTTETFTGVAAAPLAFEFVVAGSASATTTNLAAAISADSTLWDAVVTSSLDNLFASGIDPSFVIYRSLTTSATDRVYGTLSGGQARIQVLSFAQNLSYTKTGAVQLALPSVDGGTQLFGFSRVFSALSPGERHQVIESLSTFTWDSDDQLWRETSATRVGQLKGSALYAGASPIYSEWNALLPAVGDSGYLYKGATDPVFHAFRRSTAAGTLADLGIVEMT